MDWHKKGTWTWADTLYWFFYLPVTAGVIMVLVIIPEQVLNTAINPVKMDAAIFEERALQHLAKYSPATGADSKTLTQVPDKVL